MGFIKWSDEKEPNEKIRYNHIIAFTPLGEVTIEWKGWKDHDGMCVYLDGEYIDCVNDLEDAKSTVSNHILGKATEIVDYVWAMETINEKRNRSARLPALN